MAKNNQDNPQPNQPTRRKLIYSHILVFLAGIALAGWGTYLFMSALPKPPPTEDRAASIKNRLNDRAEGDARTGPPAQKPSNNPAAPFDPAAEAQRINALNQENMRRAMQGPTPVIPRPSAPRPVVPTPPRPQPAMPSIPQPY